MTLDRASERNSVLYRIGCVTGRGISDNLRRHYHPWLVRLVVLLLLAGNGRIMGRFALPLPMLVDGLLTLVMLAASIGFFVF